MTSETEAPEPIRQEEMAQGIIWALVIGLLIGGGGVAAYFIWFQDYEMKPTTISEVFFWIALSVISIGVVLLIKEEFQAAQNEYTSKGLKIAIVLGLVATGFLFAGAESINSLSLATVELTIAVGLAFLLGIFIWKVYAVPVYGQFGYVVVLSAGLGLSWFVRISGSSEAQLIAAAFLVGGLLYFGHAFMKKGAAEQT